MKGIIIMKMRLIKTKTNLLLLCSNGLILEADHTVLKNLLTAFKDPKNFKNGNQYWSNTCATMEEFKGTTLAYVNEQGALVILDENAFASLVLQCEYISAAEYADLHCKSKPAIKKMCANGRIDGAYKTTSGWLIPKNAPYPTDMRIHNGGHSTSKSSKNT